MNFILLHIFDIVLRTSILYKPLTVILYSVPEMS